MRYSTLHWLLIAALSDCYNVRPFTFLSQRLIFSFKYSQCERNICERTQFVGLGEKNACLMIGYTIYIHIQDCSQDAYCLTHPGEEALVGMTFSEAAAGSGGADSP